MGLGNGATALILANVRPLRVAGGTRETASEGLRLDKVLGVLKQAIPVGRVEARQFWGFHQHGIIALAAQASVGPVCAAGQHGFTLDVRADVNSELVMANASVVEHTVCDVHPWRLV